MVEAIGLLVGALTAKSAELFLVIAPCHVVLAPMPGTSLELFLVSFSFLGRCLLPVLISLLLFLVSIVLLDLLSCCLLHLTSCLVPCCHLWFLLRLGASWNWPLRVVSSACIATILSVR